MVTLACGLLSAFVAFPILWGPAAAEQNGAVALVLLTFMQFTVCIASTIPMLWRRTRRTAVQALLFALNLLVVIPAALLTGLSILEIIW